MIPLSNFVGAGTVSIAGDNLMVSAHILFPGAISLSPSGSYGAVPGYIDDLSLHIFLQFLQKPFWKYGFGISIFQSNHTPNYGQNKFASHLVLR